jgi:hypothetical protein
VLFGVIIKEIVKSIILVVALAGLTVPGIFADEPAAKGTNQAGTVTQAQSPVQKNEVRGRVVDEAGKPVPGAAWKITGTEVLRDGKWTREIRLGDPFRSIADAEGRFVITYREPIRFDLQFHKAGLAPAFLYEIAADSPDLKVTLKRGESIHGTVTRSVNGKKMAAAGETVELRLPSQDVWFQEQVTTDADGKFEFRACAPPCEPPNPPGNSFGPVSEPAASPERKWQVVCGGKVVQVDVRDGQAVEAVNFE